MPDTFVESFPQNQSKVRMVRAAGVLSLTGKNRLDRNAVPKTHYPLGD